MSEKLDANATPKAQDNQQEEMAQSIKAAAKNGKGSLSWETIYDVPVKVSVVLGSTHMPLHRLLKLSKGEVIELDRRVGEPIDILVNDRLVARGELVVEGESIGVTLNEIIKASADVVKEEQ